MNIKEYTQDLHTQLEALPFNQRMFKGEQTDIERMAYIYANIEIFEELDWHVPFSLKRLDSLKDAYAVLNDRLSTVDISSMHSALNFINLPGISTIQAYKHYLKHVCTDLRPHIYLNYMGFMFGGQIMKKRYPVSAGMYEFDNIDWCRSHIRESVQPQSFDTEPYGYPQQFVHEVKVGFRFHIAITQNLTEATYDLG
tara:strand:- start:448 stop:1038 length:591 start_codon:yes stop_codon:yes gene_type:complete